MSNTPGEAVKVTVKVSSPSPEVSEHTEITLSECALVPAVSVCVAGESLSKSGLSVEQSDPPTAVPSAKAAVNDTSSRGSPFKSMLADPSSSGTQTPAGTTT